MNLNTEQAKSLIEKYLSEKKQQIKGNDFTAFHRVFSLVEKEIGEHLNLAAISTGNEIYQKEQKQLFKILDAAIEFQDANFVFHEPRAREAILLAKKSFDFTDVRSLHGQLSNLGIQEKFLKNTLSAQEWLTDIDITRALAIMGLKDAVHISRFNSTEIGMHLHFERKKRQNVTEPYSIPFILNKGSTGSREGIHWFAGIITVDPQKRMIQYQVKDSFALNETQKKEIKKIIESAIHYQEKYLDEEKQEKAFEAFPEWMIDTQHSTIVGESKQKDSYSCGYRALHAILNEGSLASTVKENGYAVRYANSDTDSPTLVKQFYQIQLEKLEVKEEILQHLTIKKRFESITGSQNKRLSLEQIDSALAPYSLAKSEKIRPESQTHPVVIKKINTISVYDKSVAFPGGLIDENSPLCKENYDEFLTRLAGWLKNNQKTLAQLIIAPCTNEALDGLNAFSASDNPIGFEELVLNVSDMPKEGVKDFIVKLKTLLSNMSSSQLARLTLVDEQSKLNKEDLQAIVHYVKERGITVELILPKPFQNQDLQREIDEAVSTNQFKLVQGLSEQSQLKTKKSTEVNKPEKKRTRPRLDLTKNLNKEVELQQEQQVEVAVAHECIIDKEKQDKEIGALDVLSANEFDKFFTNLKERKFLISDEQYLLSEQDARDAWNAWYGHIFHQESMQYLGQPLLGGITREACEVLLKYRDKVQSGLEFDHLPRGFALVEYPEGTGSRVLHYDKNIALLAGKQDELALQFGKRPALKHLPYPLFEAAIKKLQNGDERDKVIAAQWEVLKKAEYEREAVQGFQDNLPFLLHFNKKQLDALFALSFEDGKLVTRKFELLVRHLPQIAAVFPDEFAKDIQPAANALLSVFGSEENVKKAVELARTFKPLQEKSLLSILIDDKKELNEQVKRWEKKLGSLNHDALLQVYNQYGEAGLERLFAQWEKTNLDVLKTLHQNLYVHGQSYAPFLAEAHQDAISAVQGLQGAQKEWWNLLLKQHANAAGYDDLPALVDAFKAFSTFIQDKKLEFYPLQNDAFSSVKSMPVALARITSILNHCPKEDLKEQWETVSAIPLASNGAVRAIHDAEINKKACTILLPEMDLKDTEYDAVHGYDTANSPKKIGESKDEKALAKNVYRYLAAQKHRLPIRFYQEALAILLQKDKKTFPIELKAKLAAMLVDATTGAQNSLHLASVEESLKQWKIMLEGLENFPPLPSAVKTLLPGVENNARGQFVDRLYTLSKPPALPILVNLCLMIANSLKLDSLNLFTIKGEFDSKIERLDKTCWQLEFLTKYYEDAIYEGMRFYEKADYERPAKDSIFYSHINTALSIAQYNEKKCTLANPDDRLKSLMQLISTFNLQSDKIENLNTYLGVADAMFGDKKEAVNYALFLLRQMERNKLVNDTQKLDADTLNKFIQNLGQDYVLLEKKPENYKAFIENAVQKRFEKYYPEGFFEKLKAIGIPEDVKNIIKKRFANEEQESIEFILNKFSSPGDNLQYKSLVEKIALVAGTLEASERNLFLGNLKREELFKTTAIADYIGLIDAVLERGHVNDFNYLLAQPESHGTDGLCQKAQLYLKTILPEIDKTRSKAVSKMDSLTFVTQLLLESSKDSLKRQFEDRKEDAQILESLIKRLDAAEKLLAAQKPVDLKKLQEEIQSFNEKSSFKDPAIKELDRAVGEILKKQKEAELQEQELKKLEQKKKQQPEPKPQSVTEQITTGLTRFWGFVKESFKKTVPAKQEPKAQISGSEEKAIKKVEVPTLNPQSIKDALKALQLEKDRRSYYAGMFQEVFGKVCQIAEQYPGAKNLIIDFVKNYIRGYDKKAGSLIVNAWECVETLRKQFKELDDVDIVRSLCEHYSGQEGDYTPEKLLDILRDDVFTQLENKHKKLLLKIASALLNNGYFFKPQEFKELLRLCAQEEKGQALLGLLAQFYDTAPYPSLQQISGWHEKALKENDYSKSLTSCYVEFDKTPCPREFKEDDPKSNGFHLAEAKEKTGLTPSQHSIQGVEFSEEEIKELEAASQAAKDKATADLIKEFKSFHPDAKPQETSMAKLVAAAAELLYRSKGKAGKPGSSFEINTTQYLAVYAALKSGGHNLCEIGTGEGKSRIMAIHNACQFALGKTVDFVTSDVQLARRDYLAFKSYYSLLGAKTNLIYPDTQTREYCIGGINYSDASSLSLFRNKARSAGHGDLVIDPDRTRRALLLDEADKTYFDAYDTRFNYSTQGDDKLKGIEWVYPVLVQFFDEKKHLELFYNDMDACNSAFFNFAAGKCKTELYARLKALPTAQIETWLESALTARTLRFGEDFVIEPDTTVVTPLGPKIASEARLIADGRVSPHSKFSFGVHQCLHARLNLLKQNPKRETDNTLLAKIESCKQPFVLDAEKQIIYSSTSKSLLDDYAEGVSIGVTGSIPKSKFERQEAQLFHDMTFISIPRHKGMFREDKAVRLTANAEQQLEALVEYILEATRNNQPTLVLCENDKQSDLLHEKLKEKLSRKSFELQNIQRVHSQMAGKDEDAAVIKAGKPGMVTISTPMMGRGTDIQLQGNAQEKGLKVLITYLPRERDLKQMIGRSGRFGNQGDSRLVLDKEELKKRLGKSSLNDGFYTNTETYISQQQALMDRKRQCERLIKNAVSDFNVTLAKSFFEDLLPNTDPAQHKDLYPLWIKFFREKDQVWNAIWPQILSEMGKPNPNSEAIDHHLTQFKEKTQYLWKELYESAENMKLRGAKTQEESPLAKLIKNTPDLNLGTKTKELLKEFSVKKVVPAEIKVYDRYDPAHEGRAVLYSRPFEKLRAIFRGERSLFAEFNSWRKGSGILFPNLRAWWNGHMTFGQMLLGGYSSPPAKAQLRKPVSGVKEETKKTSVTSYGTINGALNKKEKTVKPPPPEKSAIKTLEEYMGEHLEDNLGHAAAGIQLQVQNETHGRSIRVLDGKVDLASLEKGYYLRFIERKNSQFHVYGIEVKDQGNVIVHENIPPAEMKNHEDKLFKEQLSQLHNEHKIYFRAAKETGGGIGLHEDLALHYAKNGLVGEYVNSKLCASHTFPKKDTMPKQMEEQHNKFTV